MIPYIIAAIYREIEGKKDELAGGLVSPEDYRYVIGIIRGMRDVIETIKDSEKQWSMDALDDGGEGWEGVAGTSQGDK